MKEGAIEKKQSVSVREKALYSLLIAFSAMMLYFADFYIFPLLFIGVLAFFIWKVFSIETQNETRQIFEFYLSANEILREDERRWYGFEINETIQRGEAVTRSMSAAPPLVHFALGALYQQLNDHSSAVKHLSQVSGESAALESAIMFPPRELREYVRMLRKIERAPAEAPLTSSAVRSLERSRKNKGKQLLEYSLSQFNATPQLPQIEHVPESVVDFAKYRDSDEPQRSDAGFRDNGSQTIAESVKNQPRKRKTAMAANSDASHNDRKSISEVLHDIYENDIR